MAMWVITRGYYQHFSMNPCHGDNLCPYFLDNLPGFPASGDQWETTTLTCLIRRCWELPFGDLVMLSAVYCIYMCLLSAVHTCIYIYTYTRITRTILTMVITQVLIMMMMMMVSYSSRVSRASQFQETTSLGAPHPQIDMAAELHTLKTGKPPVPLFVRTEMITMISLQGTTSVGSCVGSETMYFPSQDMDRPCFLFRIIENQAFLTRSCAFSLWLLVHSVGSDWLLCWLHWHFLPIFQLWSHAFKCLDPFFRHTKKLSSSKTSSLLPNCPVHSPPWRVPSLLTSSNHWFWFPPL